MKTLTKPALAVLILTSTLAAQAGWVNGYSRNDGTYISGHYRSDSGSSGSYSSLSRDNVYRNPYAAYPSESVSGYSRNDGTTVLPYRRTPANDTVTDNLNYRGYGTIHVPRSGSGW
jgi:hypothetical protein